MIGDAEIPLSPRMQLVVDRLRAGWELGSNPMGPWMSNGSESVNINGLTLAALIRRDLLVCVEENGATRRFKLKEDPECKNSN